MTLYDCFDNILNRLLRIKRLLETGVYVVNSAQADGAWLKHNFYKLEKSDFYKYLKDNDDDRLDFLASFNSSVNYFVDNCSKNDLISALKCIEYILSDFEEFLSETKDIAEQFYRMELLYKDKRKD